MGARQVRSPTTPGDVQGPPPPPHGNASRTGVSIGLQLQQQGGGQAGAAHPSRGHP